MAVKAKSFLAGRTEDEVFGRSGRVEERAFQTLYKGTG